MSHMVASCTHMAHMATSCTQMAYMAASCTLASHMAYMTGKLLFALQVVPAADHTHGHGYCHAPKSWQADTICCALCVLAEWQAVCRHWGFCCLTVTACVQVCLVEWYPQNRGGMRCNPLHIPQLVVSINRLLSVYCLFSPVFCVFPIYPHFFPALSMSLVSSMKMYAALQTR